MNLIVDAFLNKWNLLLALFLCSSYYTYSQKEDIDWVNTATQKANEFLTSIPDSSLHYGQKALEKSTDIGYDEGEAVSNLIIGKVFINLGVFSKAATHLFQARTLFQIIDSPFGLIETHNSLGELYYYTRQPQEALAEHQLALDLSRKHKFPEQEALTLGYIGHFYEKEPDYDKALNYQLLALQKYKELDDAQGLSTIYGNIGSVYEDLEAFNKAYEYFTLALEYNLRTSNEEERIIHLNNLGDVHRKRGEIDQAISYTSQALSLAQKLENVYQVRSAKRDLSKSLIEEGRFQEAYHSLEEAYELNEDLFDEEGLNQIAKLRSLYELSETQRELDNLKRDQRIGDVVRIALVIGLCLLAIVFFLVINRQKLKNKKDKELLGTKQALTLQELENSQLREKQLESDLESRAIQLSTHTLSLLQKNKILKEVKTQLTHLSLQNKSLNKPIYQLIHKIDQSSHFEKDWNKFNQIFEQVHPEFYRELHHKFPDLTSAEIRLCALLRLNLPPKDIASILGISLDSLRVSRYRLRKKLGLDRSTNLITFIMNI